MDDLSIILYIVIGIIYLLSRVFRSKETPPQVPDEEMQEEYEQSQGRPPKEKRKPSTFEELLREFSGETEIQEKPKKDFKQSPATPDLKQQKADAMERMDDEIREVYEKSISQKGELKTIDELVEIKDTKKKVQVIDIKSKEKKKLKASKYARMLKNKDDIKGRKVSLYFFDGPHKKQDQFDGLDLAYPLLADDFLIFVDDAFGGTEEAVKWSVDKFKEKYQNTQTIGSFKDPRGISGFWEGLIVLKGKK